MVIASKRIVATLRSLPSEAQTIAGFARFIGCHRSTSQRLFNAYKSKTGERVLYHLPGHQALTELGLQLAPFLPEQLQRQWHQIATLFAETIPQYARSHTQLKRLLVQPESTSTDISETDKRAQLYFAAKSLLGNSSEEIFGAYILTRNPHRPGFLQEVAMISKTGIFRETGSALCTILYSPPPTRFSGPKNITAKCTVNSNEFSVGIAKELSAHLIDSFVAFSPTNSGMVFDTQPGQTKFDATFLFNNPDELVDPLSHASQCSSTSISIKSPSERLVLMVFIETELDKHSTVNVGCYQGNQQVQEGKLSASDMWTERLPEFPSLQLVNSHHLASHSNNRYQPKLEYLFNYANLDSNNYRCYLLEVDYPIWSSTYRIYFEH